MFASKATRTGVQLPSPPAFAFGAQRKSEGCHAVVKRRRAASANSPALLVTEPGISCGLGDPTNLQRRKNKAFQVDRNGDIKVIIIIGLARLLHLHL